jgi:hypothetical protein
MACKENITASGVHNIIGAPDKEVVRDIIRRGASASELLGTFVRLNDDNDLSRWRKAQPAHIFGEVYEGIAQEASDDEERRK